MKSASVATSKEDGETCVLCQDFTENKKVKGSACVICEGWVCEDCTDFGASGDYGIICTKCSERFNLTDSPHERIAELVKERQLV